MSVYTRYMCVYPPPPQGVILRLDIGQLGQPHCDGWFLRFVVGQVGEPQCNGWFPLLVMCHMGEPHCDDTFFPGADFSLSFDSLV